MIDLLIYERGVGYIGEISSYQSLEIERNYYSVSKMVLRLQKNLENAELLKLGNIITTSNNYQYGYYIDHFSAITENNIEIIEVYAYSLNYILSFRTILRQLRFSGNIEQVVKQFIVYSAIIPEDPNRIIEDLVIGPNSGIIGNANVSRTGGDLLTNSFDILKEYESSIDILINNNNQFEVLTWQGLDRSVGQGFNPNVIFSTDYDNVLRQNYFKNQIDYKNVVIVAGQGEGVNRFVSQVGSGSGWERRELYVDARDISQQYQDEEGNIINLSDQEYIELLNSRGLEQISNKNIVESFESTVNDVQYVLGRDYNLGDLVTFVDESLNIRLNVRVTSIRTISNKDGVVMIPSFGTGIPNKLLNTEV